MVGCKTEPANIGNPGGNAMASPESHIENLIETETPSGCATWPEAHFVLGSIRGGTPRFRLPSVSLEV